MPVEYVQCGDCPQVKWIHNGKCDSCNSEMERVIDDNTLMFKDSLELTINGGYGMIYDGPPVRYIVCKNCSERILSSEKWIKPTQWDYYPTSLGYRE